MVDELALELGHRAVDQHHAALAPFAGNPLEALGLVLIRKSPRVRLVLAGHDADAELWMAQKQIVHRRAVVDTDKHQWRGETDGAKGAHRHTDVALAIARGDDGDA